MAVLPQNYSILQLFAIPPIRVTGSPIIVARRDSANHYHPPFRYDAVLMLPVTLGLLENSALDRTSDFRCIRCKCPGRETQNAIDALRGLKRVSLAHHPTPVEPTFRLGRWSSSLGEKGRLHGSGDGRKQNDKNRVSHGGRAGNMAQESKQNELRNAAKGRIGSINPLRLTVTDIQEGFGD